MDAIREPVPEWMPAKIRSSAVDFIIRAAGGRRP